ncbi:MAG TPA: ABC transporter substrate-binding protein [Stellaceae bacterium]|jgi:branched-chain amino acid transport system substrate-binding protein|nr:ABC transporter substrate-binding protein [Stellaceae bacterium]
MHMTSRFILALLGASLAGIGVAAAQTEIKIGVISTMSGPDAQPGDEMNKGIDLYVKTHEKDLPPGVKVTLIYRDDTGANPDIAKRLATELVTRDHVNFLAGAVWSPNASAIAAVATQAKTPFIDMNAAAAPLTRLSPYMIRDSFTLWQVAGPIGEWAAKQGWKKSYTAVTDYPPGYDAEGGFTTSFEKGGGKVVDKVRMAFPTEDFSPFIQRIKDSKPDVAFIFVPAGKKATAVMKAWNDLGLKQAGVTLVTTQDVMLDEELPNMTQVGNGIVSSGTYSNVATRPANQMFMNDWHGAYGDKAIPDFMSVQGWDGMDAIYAVIKQTKGKFDGDQAMKILSNWKSDNSPRGPIAINPATRDIVENIYIRRGEMVNGKLANVEFDTIPNVKDPWKEANPPK